MKKWQEKNEMTPIPLFRCVEGRGDRDAWMRIPAVIAQQCHWDVGGLKSAIEQDGPPMSGKQARPAYSNSIWRKASQDFI